MKISYHTITAEEVIKIVEAEAQHPEETHDSRGLIISLAAEIVTLKTQLARHIEVTDKILERIEYLEKNVAYDSEP